MNDMQFVKRQLIQCYFLVFLMIVATASPCFAQASDLASKREEAIKIIEDAGGKVGYDEVLGPDGDVIHTSLYVDFNSQQGIMTNTYQPETTIEALVQLQAIEGIETVELSRNENIADEHLAYLKSLKDLKVLYLFRTKVRGEGLAHLANLENLKYVDLKETPCGDEVATTGLVAHVWKLFRSPMNLPNERIERKMFTCRWTDGSRGQHEGDSKVVCLCSLCKSLGEQPRFICNSIHAPPKRQVNSESPMACYRYETLDLLAALFAEESSDFRSAGNCCWASDVTRW